MEFSNSDVSSPLDEFRGVHGAEQFKRHFRRLVRQDFRKAVHALSDENTGFASLFLLRNEIRGMRLVKQLTPCHRKALEITDGILGKNLAKSRAFSLQNETDTVETLKWMLETGGKDDGLNNEFDEVLDGTAALLVKRFGDNGVLSSIVRMIFNRNRKGYYKNDLVWVLFESCDIGCLSEAAEYLLSKEVKDTEMARKLLNFIPCVSTGRHFNNTTLYSCCLNWLDENIPFLYKTGESFHQSCKPKPYKVSLESKYLCIPVLVDSGKISRQLDELEQRLLDEFALLDNSTRNNLANYSHLIYCRNRYLWNMWRLYPIAEKIRIAGGLP